MAEPYLAAPLYSPPAPACSVVLWFKQSRTEYSALIDSGAGGTCIPWPLVSALSLWRVGDADVSGATGGPSEGGVYRVNLRFLNFTYTNHPVVSTPMYARPYVLIGRDILNRHNTNLNGPSLEFTIT